PTTTPICSISRTGCARRPSTSTSDTQCACSTLQRRLRGPTGPATGPGVRWCWIGLVPRPALALVIEAMVKSGELGRAVAVDDVLKDAASIDAYKQLVGRGLIDLPTV